MASSGIIVYMCTVPGKPLHRRLIKPLPLIKQDGTWDFIPIGFESDGSSTPFLLQGIFPRHQHPIAFFRHDWRCRNAKNKKERAWADKEFKKDVAKTSWKITALIGYAGVRIGAFFGVGSNF